jgi:hypothetical protein
VQRALCCAQLLLDDFTGHNIEATAALLDTAGRFLYRTPETHERMATMAEVSSLKMARFCGTVRLACYSHSSGPRQVWLVCTTDRAGSLSWVLA